MPCLETMNKLHEVYFFTKLRTQNAGTLTENVDLDGFTILTEAKVTAL